jgi:hypothetical protein
METILGSTRLYRLGCGVWLSLGGSEQARLSRLLAIDGIYIHILVELQLRCND